MFKSTKPGRMAAALVLAALALVGLGLATAANGAAARNSERLVVRGEATVQDRPCEAGVCVDLTGAFRGTPVGSGAYNGTVTLDVANSFENGEGGVCAPISGRIVLGAGTPDRLVIGLFGDSCQDGAGNPGTAAFTNIARFFVKHGTGAYAKATGSGLLSSFEDAADVEHMTLIGRITR